MERQDWLVVGGGLLVSLGAALWADSQGLAAADIGFSGLLPKIAVVVLLAGAIFAYLAKEFYGGTVNRGLTVIASGFLIYGVLYWPHKGGVPVLASLGLPLLEGWHGSGTPAWFGIIEPAWQTFFHLLTVITLGFVAYGFYLIWRSGKQ